MKKVLAIQEKYANPVLNICLDTLRLGKQAIVFVGTKNSAEAEAERIAGKIKPEEKLEELADKALNALDRPTKQCKRLALCLRSGVAFHHSGLHSKQRELVEENFFKGNIKIICATPTLAYGLNLPAFRVIVRDLKRFSAPRGMGWIPVLEFLQFCGRAGRPDFNEEYGEAICIAETSSEKERIVETYINGEPEDILSKLAVEPVLRTYVLSLIATEYARDIKSLLDFFEKTFYAHQFGNLERLEQIITRILKSLEEWEFIEIERDKLDATLLGRRVTELYLDPYTANYLISCMKRAKDKTIKEFSFLQMVSWTLEMRPLLNIRVSEFDIIESKAAEFESSILSLEPSMFEPEYEEFLKSLKTALYFYDWINEADEESLLEVYNVRPGESKVKLDLADWLLYSSIELAKLSKMHGLVSEMTKARIRLQHGAKEELLPLLRLQGIGRVRARKLFSNKVKTLEDIRKAELTDLERVIGKQIALSIKEQVGEGVKDLSIPKGRRKGQLSIEKY